MLKQIIPFAHDLLRNTINEKDIVIDATCGNGNDTLFLSELVGNDGQVYAFDIQETAIHNSQIKTAEAGYTNVRYLLDSHANINQHLPEHLIGQVSGAIFNLGYLPRSDKSIITKADSTLAATKQILTYLKKKGLIVIVVYHGHEGGKEEKNAVLQFASGLAQEKYAVATYEFINQRNNPPFIIAIQKRN